MYGGTYGTSTTGIIGKHQNILTGQNKLKESNFTVIIPSQASKGNKKSGGTCSGTSTLQYTRDITQMISDINSMVNHAKRENINIRLVE